MSLVKRSIRIFGFVLILTVLGALIGCQGANPASTAGEKEDSVSREPVSGGTLKVAFSADPDSIDWMYTGATATRDVGWHIFESLFALDKDYEVRPMIAEDLEISDDQTLYTITIRPDVNFHNGEVVTVEDVIASIERWRSISHVGQIANAFIESVEAIDDVTIEIQLNEVYNSLLDDFAAPKSALMIIPQDIAEEAGEQPLQPEQLVGTGPYEFKEWNKGHELILTKYDDYSAREEADWGGLTGEKVAYFDEIKFQIVKDPQVGMNGVKTGLYDYAQSISPDLIDAIEADSNIDPVTYIDGYSTITPNKSKEPFSDLKVRQALNYAIDNEAMAKAVYGNEQFYGLDGALFDPTQRALYSEEGTEAYTSYDQEKAKELLEQSNYNGETLTVIYANNYPDFEKIAEVMKQQLEEVGFQVELIAYEWATYLEKWTDPDHWDIAVVSWSTRFSPNELGMLAINNSSSGYYESERWESLLTQWAQAEIGDERDAILGEMNETVWEELPFLKVANSTSLHIKTNKLHNYDNWVGARFWNTWKEE